MYEQMKQTLYKLRYLLNMYILSETNFIVSFFSLPTNSILNWRLIKLSILFIAVQSANTSKTYTPKYIYTLWDSSQNILLYVPQKKETHFWVNHLF